MEKMRKKIAKKRAKKTGFLLPPSLSLGRIRKNPPSLKLQRVKRRKFKLKRGRPKRVFLEDRLQQLIAKGKTRGFITPSEILYFFPEVEKDIKGLEKLYENLEKSGIEVKEAKELLEIEELKKSTAGQAKIDSIQMYLKEIGQTPFLTANGEKELAKRIEKGDEEAKKKLAKANLR